MDLDAPMEHRGIEASGGFTPTTIKILFVIDGRIFPNKTVAGFGLGYVLDTLRANWSWWTRFDVDIATRELSISPEALGGNAVKYLGFKFSQTYTGGPTEPFVPGRPHNRPETYDIDKYDQIWIFADQPNQHGGRDVTTDAHIVLPYTLDEIERRVLAEWMDRGGGVFATGDHGVLGASMCSRIPRVGTMRKWTRSQGVPSPEGQRRNQTLQGPYNDSRESDTLLQPVDLVYWQTANHFPFFRQHRPHPLMCSRWGPIDRFPDHMHEGEIMPDALVELDRPLNISNYDRPEYPASLAGGSELRPRPLTVAYGQTTNPTYPENISGTGSPVALAGAPLPFFHGVTKHFGLVSVYDGDSAHIGRVICDSTWHHWLNMNVYGIRIGDAAAYRKIQAYYRNVGTWLATPAQRQAMLVSAVWGILIGSAPMLFGQGQSTWEMGENALEILADNASPCWISEVVNSFLDADSVALRNVRMDVPSSEPDWSGLPSALVERAMIGGLCQALIGTASEYRRASGLRADVPVDVKALGKEAAKGPALARDLLRSTFDDAAKSMSSLRDRMARAPAVTHAT